MSRRISLSPGFCLTTAAMLMLLPFPWVAAAGAAAAFHELCHLGVILLGGGKVHTVYFRSGGAEIRLSGLGYGWELAAAAAGPAGSLMLACLGRFFPRAAVCGLIQGIFNLIPIYPMDGGRMLVSLLSRRVGPGRAEAAAGTVGCIALGAVLGFSVFYGFARGFQAFSLIFIPGMLLKSKYLLQTDTAGSTMG